MAGELQLCTSSISEQQVTTKSAMILIVEVSKVADLIFVLSSVNSLFFVFLVHSID